MDIFPKTKETDNWLRATTFNYPDWIPAAVGILPATWLKFGEKLEEIVLSHPKFFPEFKKGSKTREKVIESLPPDYRAGVSKDVFGCGWENLEEGMVGVVKAHPLDDLERLMSYEFPDSLKYDLWGKSINWDKIKNDIDESKKMGKIGSGGLFHGFFFLRMADLRGFENLMIDIATDEPGLKQIEEKLFDYNMAIVQKFLDLGIEVLWAGEDLGTQKALPISPGHFRKHIKPYYSRLFGECKKRGCLVYLHSDGHILEIIDDLIECGVTVLNPQVRANTIEGLEKFKGKVAINLDLDRQMFPFADEKQLREHFKKAVDALYLKQGGLMLNVEIGPDLSLDKISLLLTLLEEFAGPWM